MLPLYIILSCFKIKTTVCWKTESNLEQQSRAGTNIVFILVFITHITYFFDQNNNNILVQLLRENLFWITDRKF